MSTQPSLRHQSGAALVVGLILLVVLTLMALSSMNTASLDLIMSGNEQYRARAFHAAEAGIAQALATTALDTSTDVTVNATSNGVGNDTYSYQITRPFGGDIQSLPPEINGVSTGKYGAIYFEIKATGISERGSTGVNTQGLYEIVKQDDSTQCDTSLGSCTLN